ncbi:unnamed protein product [Rotaria magnacalcarata]|uniref:EF-hand domain-containing protein n=1 Tax=Rotaria magnacalcarata TaxID=392030 RepID=A0A819V2U6_9BILA|nr:unnamed protein product [Rotaria magnacalcarata]CAF1550636.1 unnamed protein product [Rotaria magnacalcarata]CAF2102388.1 unnamed protein product [Rotaria magnacalcarata]CAF2178371.1 unnamed protein product [Rotaria magnacalcarata]CAF2203787.1 unnamed protein product [Rotaria magnacalcarata]
MTQIHYTIYETVYRRYGKILQIDYEYEETKFEQIEENMQVRQEKLEKKYTASFKRDEYERIANQMKYQRDVLPFDAFVKIIRPFMMGTYVADEIHEAFRLLDTDSSKTIDLYELSAFISVIHPNMSKDTILNFINKVSENGRQEIDFNQFVQMVLEGIGRDIVCGRI